MAYGTQPAPQGFDNPEPAGKLSQHFDAQGRISSVTLTDDRGSKDYDLGSGSENPPGFDQQWLSPIEIVPEILARFSIPDRPDRPQPLANR